MDGKDFWGMFPDQASPASVPMTEQEALGLLRARPIVELPSTISHEILKPGTLVHFLPRNFLAQALVQGLVNEKIAGERKIVRAHEPRSAHDKVFLAQLRDEELEETHPLKFLSGNVTDYALGFIDEDGLLSTIGIVVDPNIPELKWNGLTKEGIESRLKADQLYIDEVRPEYMHGYVLVDYGGCLDIPIHDKEGRPTGVSGKYSQVQIDEARKRTTDWLKENILPYHQAPVFSQDTGSELL